MLRHLVTLSLLGSLAAITSLAGCRDAAGPEASAHALIRGQVVLTGDVPMANSDLSISCAPAIDWWIISVANTDATGHFAMTFSVSGEAADAVRRSTYLIDCHFHAPGTAQPAVLNVDQLVRFGPGNEPAPATDLLLRQNIPAPAN